MRTLPLRIARQTQTAGSLALLLADDSRVSGVATRARVRPGHERARAQMDGFGAIVSFELADAAAADR